MDAIIRDLPRSTVLMGVPTFYTRMLDTPEFSAETCRNMRLFISGSAPLLPETFAGYWQMPEKPPGNFAMMGFSSPADIMCTRKR